MAHFTVQAASAARLQKEVNHLRHELKTVAEGHPAAAEHVTIGDYLLERLSQLGVTVSTLPGASLSMLGMGSEPLFTDRFRCSGRL